MTDISKLGPKVWEELQKRAIEKDSDPLVLSDEFADEDGARILHSQGDGEVSMLVPVRDGFDDIERVTIAPKGRPTEVIDQIEPDGKVTIEGVGKFYEFRMSPLQWKKKLKGDGERPMIMMQGVYEDGTPWSPFGMDGQWFLEDLAMVVDMATNEHTEVRPDVEIDPNDPSWKRVDDEQRSFLEHALGRVVPEVVHESTIAAALDAAAKIDDETIKTAIRSLSLALDDEAPVETVEIEAPNFEPIREIFEEIFGAELFDANALPRLLLTTVEDALRGRGDKKSADVVLEHIRGNAVDEDALISGIDSVMGSGFTDARVPTIELIDSMIDSEDLKIGIADIDALRRHRAALDTFQEMELFGVDMGDRSMSSASADQKLREIHQHLHNRTGVDEQAIFTLASRLHSALNVPSKKPHIIVLAGDGGPGMDRVLSRAVKLCEGKPVEIQGASDLRGTDPVGYLVGSPMNEPGSAQGVLLRESDSEGRFVTSMTGLDKMGKAISDPEERAITQKSFWNFMAQVRRDGWFRGYDPDDETALQGKKMDVGGGVIFLRTEESVAELREKMSDDVWAQIAPNVISVEKSEATDVMTHLVDGLQEHIIENLEQPDAQVELSDSAKSFIKDLVDAGMSAEDLQRTLMEGLCAKLYFARLEGNLAPRVRIDFARGITARGRQKLIDAWVDGRMESLAGVGTCPLTPYDAGAFEARTGEVLSARVKAKLKDKEEVAKLKALVREYQMGALKADEDIDNLLAVNDRLGIRIDSAEGRIDQLSFLNAQANADREDLKRLNKEAENTIVELKGDLQEANDRIDDLNEDLRKAKVAAETIHGKLKEAHADRDKIEATLRRVEGEFEQAIRGMAGQAGSGDPLQTLQMVEQSAGTQNRYTTGMLRQMHNLGTARALEQALGYARNRQFDRFDDIASLAGAYQQSARAIGAPIDRSVMQGFEQAAFLTGSPNRNQRARWAQLVGTEAQWGQDPSILGHGLSRILKHVGIRF